MMKKRFFTALIAAALALSVTACGNQGNDSNGDTQNGDNSNLSQSDTSNVGEIKKEDCNSVYAEIIAVNGDNLTASVGERVLSLTVSTDILLDWKEGEQVILFYTGEFGDDMQVHYIDKWTQNSEVQKPDSSEKDSQENSGGTVLE